MSFCLETTVLLVISCYVVLGSSITTYVKNQNGRIDYQSFPGYTIDLNNQLLTGSSLSNGFDNLPQNDGLTDPQKHQTVIELNSLIAALLLSRSLGLPEKSYSSNHPGLVPINPYLALLLSNYGRYVPIPRLARGLYGYAATSNYQNNQPLGTYKVYEDK